ncbi:siderophore ferric iron reductase [Marinomonas algicola]|uniref:siderophore ferric iron reductase n=1 Tax=Marinomonas algicola TaxID=2773454 RepID=UPI0017498306|nr:siderophore ferric iron reductase [Marinomonas algicola]
MTKPLEQLFQLAHAFSAPLKGKEWREGDALEEFLACHASGTVLSKLHQSLQETHPEAGSPYWRVRAWELSWWQPISLAMMCVYHLQMVPDTLTTIRQYQQHNYIAGYALKDGTWLTSNRESRIQSAASQLATVFDGFLPEHSLEFKGKTRLYKALLADLVMAYLSTATRSLTRYDVQSIKHDYLLWADSLLLPHDPITKIEQQGDQLVFIRKTCCLAFRCANKAFCSNCPKHKKLS